MQAIVVYFLLIMFIAHNLIGNKHIHLNRKFHNHLNETPEADYKAKHEIQ